MRRYRIVPLRQRLDMDRTYDDLSITPKLLIDSTDGHVWYPNFRIAKALRTGFKPRMVRDLKKRHKRTMWTCIRNQIAAVRKV